MCLKDYEKDEVYVASVTTSTHFYIMSIKYKLGTRFNILFLLTEVFKQCVVELGKRTALNNGRPKLM